MEGNSCKIAVLSVHSSPLGNMGEKDTGGMSAYLREVCCELGKLGFSIDIFTRSVEIKRGEKIERIGPGARLIHLRAGPSRKVSKDSLPQYIPQFVQELECFRKKHRLAYDIIFSHYWISGLAGMQLQEPWKVPHLTMFHTLGAVKKELNLGGDDPLERLEKERLLAHNSSHIIVAAEREKGKLLYHYNISGEKVSVIPCGVNMEVFRPFSKIDSRKKLDIDVNEKIALYVGRLDPVKGIYQLLQALKGIKYKFPFRLVVAGGNEEEINELKQYCRRLQLKIPVNFVGPVEYQMLPYYYNAADFLVLPSYYESFGLVALEALACGTPVLAADVGDLGNIIEVGKTGYIVSNNDPIELGNKMEELLEFSQGTSPGRIRESVYSFNWSSVSAQIAQKCADILESTAKRS